MRDNYDRRYFKDNFEKILENQANIFMYVPKKDLESNEEMINFINDSIIKSSRTGIDLYLNIYDKENKLKREDHNIIVTNSGSFTPLLEWHDEALDRIYGGNSLNKGNFVVISSEPSVFSSYHKGYKPIISSK